MTVPVLCAIDPDPVGHLEIRAFVFIPGVRNHPVGGSDDHEQVSGIRLNSGISPVDSAAKICYNPFLPADETGALHTASRGLASPDGLRL